MNEANHQLTFGNRVLYITVTTMPLHVAAEAGAMAVTTKIDRELVTPDDLSRIVAESAKQIESGEPDASEA